MADDPNPMERLVKLASKVIVGGIHTGLPARVTAFNRDPRASVDVQPVIPREYEPDDDSDGWETEQFEEIPDVPVQYIQVGGFTVKHPVDVGDTGFLHIAERPIANWLETGDDQPDPSDARRHHETDAIFDPRLSPYTDRPAVNAATLEIESDSGLKLELDAGTGNVKLTTGGNGSVILEDDTAKIPRDDHLQDELSAIKSQLDDIFSAYNEHTHGSQVPPPNFTGELANQGYSVGQTETDSVKGD